MSNHSLFSKSEVMYDKKIEILSENGTIVLFFKKNEKICKKKKEFAKFCGILINEGVF